MRRKSLPLSYEKRTEVLLFASRFIGFVAVPCRTLARLLYKAARCLERLPEYLSCITLDIMEPANVK